MFLGLLDPDPVVRGMDPDQAKIVKNFIHTVLRLLFDFLSLKLVFIGILKVNDKNSMIRIRIH
jgi:hypothetical protein